MRAHPDCKGTSMNTQFIAANAQGYDVPLIGPVDKVIVTVPGIVSQKRNRTVRSAAMRFASPAKIVPPTESVGLFFSEQPGTVNVIAFDLPVGDALTRVGFAEIFWADIPRTDDINDILEEPKEWIASV